MRKTKWNQGVDGSRDMDGCVCVCMYVQRKDKKGKGHDYSLALLPFRAVPRGLSAEPWALGRPAAAGFLEHTQMATIMTMMTTTTMTIVTTTRKVTATMSILSPPPPPEAALASYCKWTRSPWWAFQGQSPTRWRARGAWGARPWPEKTNTRTSE